MKTIVLGVAVLSAGCSTTCDTGEAIVCCKGGCEGDNPVSGLGCHAGGQLGPAGSVSRAECPALCLGADVFDADR